MVIINLSKVLNISAVMILAGVCCISLNLNAKHESDPELTWYQIGYQDGHEGQSSTMFKEYTDMLLLSSSSDTERDSYMKGWKKGLQKYCNMNARESKKDLLCEHYL
ncbi:DUF2799 domain-containing protein [Succinimonas amylolytica]|uniref:DUF2799 domain-containing protein n=1 Tax=Succinimonas amylolytica TaxID=83769 RepID=UPI0023A8956B